jgi:hypothetical protein
MNVEKLYSDKYWLHVTSILSHNVSKDIVNNFIIPYIYVSLNKIRFHVFTHIVNGLSSKNISYRNNKLNKITENKVEHPLFFIFESNCNYKNNIPSIDKNKITLRKKWYHIIDKMINKLNINELLEILKKDNRTRVPFYYLHYYAWRQANFKYEYLPGLKLDMKTDPKYLQETWGYEEIKFEDITGDNINDYVICFDNDKNRELLLNLKVIFVDDIFNKMSDRKMVVFKGGIRKLYPLYKNNLPKNLRIFAKRSKSNNFYDLEKFTCKWENNNIEFELFNNNKYLERIYPWNLNNMDLVLMTYQNKNTRNILIFRLLKIQSLKKWSIKLPNQTIKNISIYY